LSWTDRIEGEGEMTTSGQAAVVQVRQIGNVALQNALEILLLIELLETQNGNGINECISDAGAGGAGIVVRNSLITRLVLLVSQCYWPPTASKP
jgi:hypothetical protein